MLLLLHFSCQDTNRSPIRRRNDVLPHLKQNRKISVNIIGNIHLFQVMATSGKGLIYQRRVFHAMSNTTLLQLNHYANSQEICCNMIRYYLRKSMSFYSSKGQYFTLERLFYLSSKVKERQVLYHDQTSSVSLWKALTNVFAKTMHQILYSKRNSLLSEKYSI